MVEQILEVIAETVELNAGGNGVHILKLLVICIPQIGWLVLLIFVRFRKFREYVVSGMQNELAV